MTPAVFETAISVIERPETHALNRSPTGIGRHTKLKILKKKAKETPWRTKIN